MLLSICILFCDKDYQYIDGLLKNIKSNVQVNYEVILIDNRRDKSQNLNFIGAKTFPCDKLGQFNGRRMAISKASGDYIWFVDADDSINKVPSYFRDEMSQFYDIITFNAYDSFGDWTGTWPTRKPEDRDRVFHNSNLLTLEMETLVGPCVWNKFFKRDVLLPAVDLEDEYLTYNEDSLFNMIALKHSTTIRTLDVDLYNYNSEVSQAACKRLNDFSKFENLISSGLNLFKIREKIFTGKDKEETDKWIPKPLCIQFFNHRVYHSVPELQEREMKLLCDTYGYEEVLDAINKHVICEIEKEVKSREEIRLYLVDLWNKVKNSKTEISTSQKPRDKSLSICFNFCDKDFKYVPNLIRNIKNMVKLKDYEIVICDNRTKDNGKDEYIEGVKIWPTGGNLGPLGGRKDALKHITKDYVWYLDADDLLHCPIEQGCQDVLNKNCDYVAFKALDDEGKTSGIWADTSLYDDKEINDDFLFSYRTYVMSGATLWNKWVKTEVFKCILDIPDTTAVCYEDALCNSYIMKHSKSMYLYNAYLYKYRSNLGDANRSNITELASFKRTTNGGRTTLDLAKKLFTEDELFAMDAWFSDLRYLEFSLKRVVDSDSSIQEDELKDLLQYFSVEDIAATFKYFTWYFDKKKTAKAFRKFEKITSYKEKSQNKKCKLTISIAFFDKDLKRIHKLLKNVKDRIKVSDYEIILINNCQYNNKYIPMLNGIPVIPTGSTPDRNLGTYYTRQLGLKHAHGEYIWFIDADDEIIADITEDDLKLLDKNYDIVVFNSEKENHKPTGMGKYIEKPEVLTSTGNLLSNETYGKIGPCLWNKWIKVENLKDILTTPAFAINAFEDTLVSASAEKHSKSIYLSPKLLYRYDCSNSNTCSDVILKEDIDKIFLGKDKISSLKELLFSPLERQTVFSLSEAYSDNFFKSRLKKQEKPNNAKFCILTPSAELVKNINAPVIRVSDNIEKIKNFEFVFINICGKRIKNLSISDFRNLSFSGQTTVNQRALFSSNFLLTREAFLALSRGKTIEVEKNTVNIIET